MGFFGFMAVGASNFFKCRGKLGFWGFIGKGNPSTALVFVFGTSLIKLHVDIFSGSCGRMGAFFLPPFSFSASVMAKL